MTWSFFLIISTVKPAIWICVTISVSCSELPLSDMPLLDPVGNCESIVWRMTNIILEIPIEDKTGS